jgi:hypothetical protein
MNFMESSPVRTWHLILSHCLALKLSIKKVVVKKGQHRVAGGYRNHQFADGSLACHEGGQRTQQLLAPGPHTKDSGKRTEKNGVSSDKSHLLLNSKCLSDPADSAH